MERVSEYPLILQQQWILSRILETVKPNSTHTRDLIENNFINYDPPRKKNTTKTPLARILQHVWICPNGDLISVIGDSTSKMYARFPYEPTVEKFERAHNQRITMGTKLCVILIKRARLKFTKAYRLHRDTGIHTKRAFTDKFGVFKLPRVDVVMLEILDFEIFQRDQAQLGDQLLDSFRFVYLEKSYKERFSMDSRRMDSDKEAIEQDYDDVVSM